MLEVSVDYDGDGRHRLVAGWGRECGERWVSLRDVVSGSVTARTAALLGAYRRWSDGA
ncbi:MAG: hypothetical protein ACRD2W_00815 [Acidimicrobiales bacterium]